MKSLKNILAENSIYSDAATKSAHLSDKSNITGSFLFNFLGILGLLNGTSNQARIKAYFKSEKKLQIDTISDENRDMSLALKHVVDAGYFRMAVTPRMITRFLVKLRMGTISKVDETIVREWVGDLKPSFRKDLDVRLRPMFIDYTDGTITLAQLAIKLRKYVRMYDYTGEFIKLMRTQTPADIDGVNAAPSGGTDSLVLPFIQPTVKNIADVILGVYLGHADSIYFTEYLKNVDKITDQGIKEFVERFATNIVGAKDGSLAYSAPTENTVMSFPSENVVYQAFSTLAKEAVAGDKHRKFLMLFKNQKGSFLNKLPEVLINEIFDVVYDGIKKDGERFISSTLLSLEAGFVEGLVYENRNYVKATIEIDSISASWRDVLPNLVKYVVTTKSTNPLVDRADALQKCVRLAGIIGTGIIGGTGFKKLSEEMVVTNVHNFVYAVERGYIDTADAVDAIIKELGPDFTKLTETSDAYYFLYIINDMLSTDIGTAFSGKAVYRPLLKHNDNIEGLLMAWFKGLIMGRSNWSNMFADLIKFRLIVKDESTWSRFGPIVKELIESYVKSGDELAAYNQLADYLQNYADADVEELLASYKGKIDLPVLAVPVKGKDRASKLTKFSFFEKLITLEKFSIVNELSSSEGNTYGRWESYRLHPEFEPAMTTGIKLTEEEATTIAKNLPKESYSDTEIPAFKYHNVNSQAYTLWEAFPKSVPALELVVKKYIEWKADEITPQRAFEFIFNRSDNIMEALSRIYIRIFKEAVPGFTELLDGAKSKLANTQGFKNVTPETLRELAAAGLTFVTTGDSPTYMIKDLAKRYVQLMGDINLTEKQLVSNISVSVLKSDIVSRNTIRNLADPKKVDLIDAAGKKELVAAWVNHPEANRMFLNHKAKYFMGRGSREAREEFNKLIIDVTDELVETDAALVQKLFDVIDDGYIEWKVKNNMTGKRILAGALNSNGIETFAKLEPGQIKKILAYNDVSFEDVAASFGLRKKNKENLTDYIIRMKLEVAKNRSGVLGETKVEEVKKTEEELARECVRIIKGSHTGGRHGSTYPKIIKEFNVFLSDEEFEAYRKLLTDQGNDITKMQVTPAYHGCGGIAATMILRYGFAVVKEERGYTTGRMLGDGIYFAPNIDKALQYVGNEGFGRRIGTKGYIFSLDTTIGPAIPASEGTSKPGHRSAGVDGAGWVKSAEYCVAQPRKQLKIMKAYQVEVVGMDEYNRLKQKAGDTIVESFRSFAINEARRSPNKSKAMNNHTSFVFFDGKIPIIERGQMRKAVDPKSASKLLPKGVLLEDTRRGPAVTFVGLGDDERVDVLYAENIEGGELKHYIELWNKATSRGY
jgi:hypothetical protein